MRRSRAKRSRVIMMALSPALALAAGLLATGSRGEGAEPVELRRLFPQEADVLGGSAGLSRLVLPPAILAACRPDLSDLRLFDSQERDIAFLVDAGTAPPGGVESSQRYEPRLTEAARTEIRRKTGPPLRRERYEFAMPDAAPQAGNWVLVVEPRAAEFVARVNVEGLGGAGAAGTAGATVGSAGAVTALVTDGSLFRLGGGRATEKLRLPLPPFAGRALRVVLETEHPFWLEPALRLESARVLERGGRIAVPLQVLSAHPGDRRTHLDLSRPPGIVPDLLRIETATGTFDRRVEVWDEGPAGADTALGSGRIYRVEALVPVGANELPLRPARGDRLRVEIDDGDSQPLADLAFSAVIRQPSLIFTFAGPGVTLRFGGGRAHPPRYDLAMLLPPQAGAVTGKRAEAAALLYDPATVHAADLGPVRANPAYDRAPALAFAMHPGAAIDRRVFSHLRPITVPASAEGLSRLRIEPADLAILGDDLSDLRIADEASRQWPYLLAREAATDLVPLAVDGPAQRERTSRYLLRPPVSPLRSDRLFLDTDTAYFDRGFSLLARIGDGDETTLLSGRLARPAGDPRPVSIDLAPVRAKSLTLLIEDGDDAPLVFRSVQARVLLPEVYLTAPAGRYALLLGAPDQDPPRYELERVRDVVLAVKAEPIDVGALETNRDYSLQARLKGSGFRQTILLWTVLIAAVVVLAFLTLRLARREPPAPAD